LIKSDWNYLINYWQTHNVYRPEFEKGIIFNDKTLNIDWVLPKHELKLSDKDRELQEFVIVESITSLLTLLF
jgi:dTDP-4-dehydrorhamnose 3,5-epimerase-like enzyme